MFNSVVQDGSVLVECCNVMSSHAKGEASLAVVWRSLIDNDENWEEFDERKNETFKLIL